MRPGDEGRLDRWGAGCRGRSPSARREEAATATVQVRFYAELNDFLADPRRGREFAHVCPTGNSVKDVIEGLGAPHTQVDLVLVNGRSVGFGHRLAEGDRVSVYPVFETLDISAETSVRPLPLRVVGFAVDVHLGRLAGYLRLAGFDALYRNDWDDRALAEVAARERRIVLTRDRGLLKRTMVTHGHLVGETRPRDQLLEVLDRFDLWGSLRPFSRCSLCNSPVGEVAKAQVIAEIPQRAGLHYERFWRCEGCGRVYWQGAHYRALARLFSR